jgi:pimeloyl-ACP methyl ester carboxylesterase
MTTAALPSAAIRPATLVLVDPPAMPHDVMSSMAIDTSELPHGDLETTAETLAAVNPTWFREDVWAKAEGLIQVDLEAPRAVLIDNVDWDGGLADLADPAATGIPTWIVRGDPAAGSLLPDASIRPIAELIGPDHVLTLAGAPHSPQRTHPAATTISLLRALG